MKVLSTAHTVKDTLHCLYCADDALNSLRPRFRVGTTAGVQDEPIAGALKRKLFADMEACAVDWVVCPHDGSAVAAMLNAGLIDIVMVPSEEAIMLVTSCKSLRVCGNFAGPRRTWRFFTLPGNQSLLRKGQLRRIGVPANLCASIVACLLSDWGLLGHGDRSPEIVILGSLVEGLHSIARASSRTIQGLIWECKAEELQAAKTVCVEALAPVQVPWLSHAFICGREALFTKASTIKQFFSFTNDLCADMLSTDLQTTHAYMAQHYGFTPEDIAMWISGQATWTCTSEVDWHTMTRPVDYLRRLHMLEDESSPMRCVASSCRILGGPLAEPRRPPAERESSAVSATVWEGADEFDEGKAASLSTSRSLRLFPPCEEDTIATCASPEEILRSRPSPAGPKRAPRSLAASTAEPVPAG